MKKLFFAVISLLAREVSLDNVLSGLSKAVLKLEKLQEAKLRSASAARDLAVEARLKAGKDQFEAERIARIRDRINSLTA